MKRKIAERRSKLINKKEILIQNIRKKRVTILKTTVEPM